MKNPTTSSSASSRGFTLVELLVAMAITTIIIGILVSVTSLALDTWNRSRSEVRAARQGKAMIDSMARDFESMVVRKGNNFEWLYAGTVPESNKKGPQNNTYKSPNVADLVFFSAATDRYNGNIGVSGTDKGGDVSTVAYQLRYTDPIGGTDSDEFKTFVLYRKIINPDTTFAETLGTQFTTTGTALLDKAETAASDPSITGNDIDSPSNFICENVYQFTTIFNVEVTAADGTKISVPVPLGENGSKLFKIGGNGYEMDNNITLPTGNSITVDMVKAGRLTSVEVSLTVLTDFGLKQMQRRASIPDLDDFIAQNSYQYSKLILVPGS